MTRPLTTREDDEMTDIQKQIIALVGPMSCAEVARGFGRRSSSRARGSALGAGPHQPALPPPEEDESLRNASEHLGRPRRIFGQRKSKNRVATKPARTLKAIAKEQERKADAA